MYSFKNISEPDNANTGVAEVVYIALSEWFEPGGIKKPGPFIDAGDEVIIKDSHIFKAGKGFIECSLAPGQNSYDAKSLGDTFFQQFSIELRIILPGSYSLLHEQISRYIGKSVIALIKDANCPAEMYYQIGTESIAGRISADFSTGTTLDGIKGYPVTVSNTAAKVFLYAGNITLPGEVQGIVARLSGTILNDLVSLDGSDSSSYGNTVFEYTVFFNDINDQPQTYLLAGQNGNTAQFSTADLFNWNSAGFSIKLKITNEFTSDETETDDLVDQRPLNMGGFDEGFDGGFDHNM